MNSPAAQQNSAAERPRRILIVGGSTRAAADSVRRAGWKPICADLFADIDLQRTAQVLTVRKYPDSLPEDLAKVRADGWFYCGALENRPDLIERLQTPSNRIGPLLGTPADAIRTVRDPGRLADILRSSEIPVLEVSSETSRPAPDGAWLQKPLASAGGRSIRIWDEQAVSSPLLEPHYFQHRVIGMSMSAIFSFDEQKAELFGISRELASNELSTPPSEFGYSGNCGPMNEFANRARKSPTGCSSTVQEQLQTIANSLFTAIPGLRGPIGLDFVFDGSTVWLTEVNPRYTASIEILEFGSGRSILNPKARQPGGTPCRRLIAKQILYAEQRIVAPELEKHIQFDDPWNVPTIADIPQTGSVIDCGWPICTVLAESNDKMDAETTLRIRASEVRTAIRTANIHCTNSNK